MSGDIAHGHSALSCPHELAAAAADACADDGDVTVAWSQGDIDLLKANIAESGDQKSVSFGDRTVTFASLDEKLRLLSVMQAEVDAATGTPRPKQRLGYQSSKGL
jgi:hypothetical protein